MSRHAALAWALLAAASLPARSAAAEASSDGGLRIRYHGAGWIQGGRIEHQSDTLSDGTDQNFNGNWTQNAGGQITAVADLGGGWEGGLGLGAIQSPRFFRGSLPNDKTVSLAWSPYVTEARLTWSLGDPAAPALQVTAGSFPFNYNRDVKNLGLYLLRGMVYPGILISGFETKHVLPIANIYGLNVRHEHGGYRGDLILNSETDVNPYFDLSLAYLFRFRVTDGLEVGAGANWYRGLPNRPRITSPGPECGDRASQYTINAFDTEVCGIKDSTVVSTPAGDSVAVRTIHGSLSGVKLMGRLALDPKRLLGVEWGLGPEDLKVYSEAAVLGLDDYPKYYESIRERIPVMVGFNLPAFGLLDQLSFEIEHYGNRNMTDYQKVVEDNSWVPRPRARFEIPGPDGNPVGTGVTDTRGDDWKWSLYASRTLAGHLKLSGQLANDHLRTGGYFLQPTQSETLTDTGEFGVPGQWYKPWAWIPGDWYWMVKVAYYF